jgi:hypothetical protein
MARQWLGLVWLALVLLTLVACAPSEEAISQAAQQTIEALGPVIATVEHTVIAAVPVTVEVTRPVEVTRLVEVTREVAVTAVVEVRVTEVVVVTATPTPTPAATATPTPTNTVRPPVATLAPPTADSRTALVQAMLTTRGNLQSFGGLIDAAVSTGFLDCQATVNSYDALAGAPQLDVSAAADAVRSAYNNYRAAIDTFLTGARDLTDNCREFLANPGGGSIPPQQWAYARDTVDTAVAILSRAIESLGA